MSRLIKAPLFWLVVLLVLGGGAAAMAYKEVGGGRKTAVAVLRAPDSPYATVANGKADVEGGIISVAARQAGIVKAVYAQEGDLVKKGQILAQQDDDAARLAHSMALAQLDQAKAQVASTLVQIEAAKRELARLQGLADKHFVATQQVDQAHDAQRELEAGLIAQQSAIAVAQAAVDQAAYGVELAMIRSPVDGRVIRRYANPGAGASTLNVSNMFDIEPDAPHIVRAEVTEAAIPDVAIGQDIEIVPESDITKAYPGKVLRRAGLYGARKLSSDDPTERVDDRVVEVVVSADKAPLLIGQRVLVRFMKPAGKG